MPRLYPSFRFQVSGFRFQVSALIPLLLSLPLHAATWHASDTTEIRKALAGVRPGDTILINPGTYSGVIHIENLAGSNTAPITIRGTDPQSPPTFQSGNEGLHLTDCQYLKLQHLHFTGFADNGINIDDGGSFDTPSHHLILEDLAITETGPHGNHDALKLSGVTDFVVRRCRFEGWGGSAIDMVGCHRGVVEECRFFGRERNDQASGIQIKGGSSNILIQTSFFHWAGQRAINIGGQTDPAFFRPADAPYEATAVEVAGNRIFGSQASIVWATSDGSLVHHNALIFPHHWILRILQESQDKRVAPCRNGLFSQNIVLYDERVTTVVNVGENTAPELFQFQSNLWHRTAGAKPLRLPGPGTANLQQIDPEIPTQGAGAFHTRATDPRLSTLGADHYTPAPAPFVLP